MVINEINLSVWKNNYIMLYARKGEINARSIAAVFETENGEYLDLSGKQVTFYAAKPDGTKVYNSCTVSTAGITATIQLTSQMVSVAGIVNCEYQIFSGDTLLLKVNGLKLVVEDGGDFSEAVESSSEYNTLVHAINEAESFCESVGSISNLTTSNKNNVVSAINEVNGKTIPISQGGTGGTTAQAARTNLEVMKGTSLWGNSAGYNGTISLSDNYSNYDFIYVQAKNAGIGTVNIFKPDILSKVTITNLYADSESSVVGMYYRGAVLDFSGTTVNFSRNGSYHFKKSSSSDDVWSATGDSVSGIWVTKIMGYKY